MSREHHAADPALGQLGDQGHVKIAHCVGLVTPGSTYRLPFGAESQSARLAQWAGIATFTRTRHLYYAADALAWLPAETDLAHSYATQAVAAYADPLHPDWAFGDAAGSRADLAITQIARRQIDGAIETLSPVLDLPPEQRINGIVHSVNRVHRRIADPDSTAGRTLQERIEDYTKTPLRSLPR